MSANLIHSSTRGSKPGLLAEITPLLPPRPPMPEAPPMAAPMIYVQKSAQWEYKQLVRNLSKEEAPTAAELNTLGKEGWELAGVTTDSPFAYFYFKRLAA
jgi:hypothetical protein